MPSIKFQFTYSKFIYNFISCDHKISALRVELNATTLPKLHLVLSNRSNGKKTE